MQLKDIFSKYRFPENKLKNLEITIIHRGAPEDKKTIPGKDIKIFSGHFEYFEQETQEWTYIPFHRILEIKDKDKIIYEKAKRS